MCILILLRLNHVNDNNARVLPMQKSAEPIPPYYSQIIIIWLASRQFLTRRLRPIHRRWLITRLSPIRYVKPHTPTSATPRPLTSPMPMRILRTQLCSSSVPILLSILKSILHIRLSWVSIIRRQICGQLLRWLRLRLRSKSSLGLLPIRWPPSDRELVSRRRWFHRRSGSRSLMHKRCSNTSDRRSVHWWRRTGGMWSLHHRPLISIFPFISPIIPRVSTIM